MTPQVAKGVVSLGVAQAILAVSRKENQGANTSNSPRRNKRRAEDLNPSKRRRRKW